MSSKDRVTKKKRMAPLHPWAGIIQQTSFDVAALEVLTDHHMILNGFCADVGDSQDSLSLSFSQYCISLSTLILYGSATQQFEYLFQAYAVESERGITRAELFRLLQDHFYWPPSLPPSSNVAALRNSSSSNKHESGTTTDQQTDARHFERLYTWLKKHIAVYDSTRCGFLPLATALEMLRAHPSALEHVQLQIDPLVTKLRENSAKYHEKAAAAQIQ